LPPVSLDYSPRENEILRLIASGQTDKQIAHTLGISRKTVGTHLARLYVRGGHHSRTEAVVRWLARPSA
jgi:DNA-binding CsgD family transcriptional regulator